MELALKKFLNNKADEELEFRMEQLEKILARQDPPWADDDFEAVKAIKAKKLEKASKQRTLDCQLSCEEPSVKLSFDILGVGKKIFSNKLVSIIF